ncbi:MAG: dTDP-glucose 4,6-dehydratase [bacterium]|nr:dTDP-glucose 4,6-dehydratase [bacterium]
MKLLVTGGAGFIGSNFIRYMLKKYPRCQIINLDKLTYCGNLDNLKNIKTSRYRFVRGDIADFETVKRAARGVDGIVNFAAETHVDRSIMGADDFIRTDILGTKNLLEAVKEYGIKKYLQVSTDEVYGSLKTGKAREDSPLAPNNPYSASKTGGDLMVRAYNRTFGLPVLITRSSNNFGPYQYPEKLIPLFITNLLSGKKVPLYGDGKNVRDWIFVQDNCAGLDLVFHKGKIGEIYNIGGDNPKTNIAITQLVLKTLGKRKEMIEYVKDRPGHDRRYALDSAKIQRLGWKPKYKFSEAMQLTIDWYRDNADWWKKIKSGEYLKYYKKQYGKK